MPLHAPKTSRSWMRIQGLVGHCPAPLHSCRVKGEFYNDRTRIYTTLYPKGRTARSARHYVISASLHMHRLFSFGVQFDRVFTCTLNHIRKGINHPLQSDRNWIPIELNRLRCLHEDFSVRLSCQSHYKLIIWLHVNSHYNVGTEKGLVQTVAIKSK